MITDCKKALLFYGPPGAGKGTQAERFATKYEFTHFDSGKFIEKLIHDPALYKRSKVIAKQRELFLSGKLCEPAWIGAEAKKRIKALSAEGKSLIMSGNPRTMEEAFELKGGGIVDLLIKEYGKENIFVVFIDIPVSESVERNSKRGRPGLDEPAVIRVRCREYKAQTLPVIKEIKRRGISVVKIDGKPSRGEVSKIILGEIKDFLKCRKLSLKKKSVSSKPRARS
jgi:adenylate kinase